MAFLLPLCQVMGSVLPPQTFDGASDIREALADGSVTDAAQLVDWFAVYLMDWLAPVEGRGVASACRAVCAARANGRQSDGMMTEYLTTAVGRLDKKLFHAERSALARESRRTAGRRYLHLALKRYPLSGLAAYKAWIQEGVCDGHPAIVHGWVCAYSRVDAKTAVHTYLSAVAQYSVQTAVECAVIDSHGALAVLGPIASELDRHVESALSSSDLQEWLVAGPGI